MMVNNSVMQFQYNSDFPGITIDPNTGEPVTQPYVNVDGTSTLLVRAPLEFPPAMPLACARITTRVYHPARHQVATVQNVLVRILPTNSSNNNHNNSNNTHSGGAATPDADDDAMSDNDSDSSDDLPSSSSDESMVVNDDNDQNNNTNLQQQQQHQQQQHQQQQQTPGFVVESENRAYWIQRTIREAIYGRVLLAVILKKRSASSLTLAPNDNAEWEVTPHFCAVKEMSWNHIRKERDRLAEDPIKEVAAMQYLRNWCIRTNILARQQQQQQQQQSIQQSIQLQQQQSIQQQVNLPSASASSSVSGTSGAGGSTGVFCYQDTVEESFKCMLESNIMMPLDLLSDDRHLYSIMPYCDGGELFERLDLNERFSEEEARYWMHQILNGLENLQRAGICHRDMSLENLLVHNESGALVIDFGMCLRVPFLDDGVVEDDTGYQNNNNIMTMITATDNLSVSMHNMNIVKDDGNNGILTMQQQTAILLQSQTLLLQQQQQHPTNNDGPIKDSTQATTITPTEQQATSTTTTAILDCRKRRRCLIAPQGTCGKWIYMSPEIYSDKEPFDGYAVDVWAAGVILFLMLTGFPPWERACPTDERFKYMTAGYLVQMLTEWDLGLTGDALDLLQRMLFLDPKDRLSLDQVRAHPWMMVRR